MHAYQSAVVEVQHCSIPCTLLLCAATILVHSLTILLHSLTHSLTHSLSSCTRSLPMPVAALMSFMNGGSADTGPLGSADSQDLGSAFGRASGQDVVPDSSTNGHTPSEGSQGASSFQAPLHGSQAGYGTRERGDGARGPERQGSYNRWVPW